MLSLARTTSVQVICVTIVIVLLLYDIAIRVRMTEQNQQQTLLTFDKKTLVQQRNGVARRLNSLQSPCRPAGNAPSFFRYGVQKNFDVASLSPIGRKERHQQLICQLINSSTSISETGGWCDSAVRVVHVTDVGLAGALARLFDGRSVAGLGDGRGDYRRLILNSGRVKIYDAYDGAPNIYNITGGQVKFLDLTLQQYWMPRYDWVLSMEVLEHISVEFETIVLDNIDRASGYGAVLSWAAPGQLGFHHVNNRPAVYLKNVMKSRGFQLDMTASQTLRTVAKFPWLKRNLMVFYRQKPLHTTAS